MDDRKVPDLAKADGSPWTPPPLPPVAAPSTPPVIGVGDVLLGKYRVERELGMGGMGVVLAVRHLELDEVFALKVLLPGAAEGSEALDRFIREAKLMARLGSEHTAMVVDVGRLDADRPYMIMEYLQGADLRKVLAERGPLPIEEAVKHILEACEAIGAAHAQGIVHRDIKPSNLFLSERPSGKPCIKVIDFGISKLLASAAAAELTSSGVALGSPLYMSPEQMVHSKHVGMSADIWALGCVLYELVTGRAPFRAESLTAVVGSVLSHEPPPPSSLRPEVPGWLDPAILRCLRKAPQDRYRTVDELAIALREGEHSRGAPAPAAGQHRMDRRGATTGQSRSAAPATPEIGEASTEIGSHPLPMVKGENRVCSVLAVDLSSAAELSAMLDLDEVKDVLDTCIQSILSQIDSLEGAAERLGIDQVTGVFGARVATEIDAERAVHAALLVQSALAKVRLPRAARAHRLTARIGIATGRVFVDTLDSSCVSVVGEALTEATALREVAAAGAVVIDRATCRRIITRFSLAPLPAVLVPGRAEKTPAFKVRGPMPFRFNQQQQLFYGMDTRLIGRDAEKRRLLDIFEEIVRERCARLVTIAGAPGAGSSRLLAELFSCLATSAGSVLVAVAEGSAFEQSKSYGVAALLLRNRFGIGEVEAPERIPYLLSRGLRFLRIKTFRRLWLDLEVASSPDFDDVLGGAMSVAGPPSSTDLREALVEIGSILDARTNLSVHEHAIRPDDEGAQKKLRVTAAATRLVRYAAARTPIVILCDDAHFVDDATLDLLDQLAARLTDRPLLIVCAARPEIYERRPHWGEGNPAHRRLDLGPLERRHVEEIIRDRLRRVPHLSSTFVQKLAARSDNNPLILDEMMHLCVHARVIEMEEGSDKQRLHEDRLGELSLPTTIRGFVQARLDRLDPAAREVLARAAVVGRTFWDGAVDALLAEQGQKCESIVSSLRDRQLVRTRDATLFPGERERIFSEGAIQEVAYDMLPSRVRRPMHLRIARWLEKRAPGSAEAALIALHADRAGDLQRAVEQYTRAAAHAISLGQNEDARRFLVRMRELHDEMDARQSEFPGAPSEIRWTERLHVSLALGDVLRRLGRLDEAEKVYLEAHGQIPAGDPDTSRWRVRADFRLALLLKLRGDMNGALTLLERAVDAARAAGIPEETPVIYAQQVFLLRRLRRHSESWEAALAGLRACRTLARDDPRRPESTARALLGLAATRYQKKRYISAERIYLSAVRVAENTADPDLLGRALNGVGVVRAALGQYKRARATYLHSLRVKERAGDLHQIAVAYSNVAELELQMNELPAAYAHAQRGVELAERIRAGSDLAEMYRILAEAALGLGRHEEAIATCLRALELGELASNLYVEEVARTLTRAVAGAPPDPPAAHMAEKGRAALQGLLGWDATSAARQKSGRR